MIYDRQPVIDHFRGINGEAVIGAMVIEGDERVFFLLLRRASPTPAHIVTDGATAS